MNKINFKITKKQIEKRMRTNHTMIRPIFSIHEFINFQLHLDNNSGYVQSAPVVEKIKL